MPTGLSDVSVALSVGGLLKEQGARGLYVSGPLSAESDGIRPWECALTGLTLRVSGLYNIGHL